MSTTITTVGVIGLGTMGAGIVEVFARAGRTVVALEMAESGLDRGRGHLEKSTGKAVSRGRLSESDQQAILGRVSYHTDLAALAPCDLVIEAVPEFLDLKKDLFSRVQDVVSPTCILATNTSSLSVTDIAFGTNRPEQVIGMHFFNPAPILKLVEVITTIATNAEVTAAVEQLAKDLGKSPVVIGDQAGFIGNAMLFGYLNHAIWMVSRQHASCADIDAAMQHGAGYPMGPLALLDLIGLDTSLEILRTIHAETTNSRYAPAPLLRQMVTAGRLGRKSGRGFYHYEAGKVVPDAAAPAPVQVTNPHIAIVGDGPLTTLWSDRLTPSAASCQVISAESATAGNDQLAQADLVLIVAEALPDLTAQVPAITKQCSTAQAIAFTGEPDLALYTQLSAEDHKVVGLQHCDLIPGSTLVEVTSTAATDQDVIAWVRGLLTGAELIAVASPERAGRIVEALLFAYLNDAVHLVDSKYATIDQVDTAMTNGCGYPEGPFAALDRIGLERVLDGQCHLAVATNDPAYAPSALLIELVDLGYYGATAGQGFRNHG